MTDAATVPAGEYDHSLLNALLREELRDFLQNITNSALTHEQEQRGALLAWFCYFTPELVSEEIRTLLYAVQERLRSRKDFDYSGWYQVLPIETALYGLTREESWLNRHKQEFAYGGRALRLYVMESLCLAAPELGINDCGLMRVVRRNLEVVHGGCQWGVVMFLAAKGTKYEKQKLVGEWCSEFRLNDDEHRVLKELAENQIVENPYFAGYFARLQAYIIQRLCARRTIDTAHQQPRSLFAGSLAAQVAAHPLMSSYLRLMDS